MTENDLLNAAIDDGEASVRQSYSKPQDHEKRDGALAGFDFCRGRSEAQLKTEAARVNALTLDMRMQAEPQNYWYWRYYVGQIEWLLNILNGARHLTGQPYDTCTASGAIKASEIIGDGVLEIAQPR